MLPAINVQYPFGQLIISGDKTIETRTYKVPESMKGRNVILIETARPKNIEPTKALGIIIFDEDFKYKSRKEFRLDYARHRVSETSLWDWTDEKGKWGWNVRVIEKFDGPTSIQGIRGIRFTKSLEIQFL